MSGRRQLPRTADPTRSGWTTPWCGSSRRSNWCGCWIRKKSPEKSGSATRCGSRSVGLNIGYLWYPGSQGSSEDRNSYGSGADRDRTGDPLVANQVLSQLSYRPREPFEATNSAAQLEVAGYLIESEPGTQPTLIREAWPPDAGSTTMLWSPHYSISRGHR